MKRLLFIFVYLFFIVHCSFADDTCLRYKTLPSLEIKVPKFSISVVQPNRPMDLLHGTMVATFSEEYEIEYGAARNLGGGWCVFLEHIVVKMGYTDFVVQIDRRHKPGSCEFDGIMEHEDKHIHAHLSAIDDGIRDIRSAVTAAANNVPPAFAADEAGIDNAMDRLEAELQNRPEIKLLRRKLTAERDIRDKKIDLNDKGSRIRGCAD